MFYPCILPKNLDIKHQVNKTIESLVSFSNSQNVPDHKIMVQLLIPDSWGHRDQLLGERVTQV